MHARAARRECLELAEQMETIWRVHKTGLRVAGASVAGDATTESNRTPTVPEEPASVSGVAAQGGISARQDD